MVLSADEDWWWSRGASNLSIELDNRPVDRAAVRSCGGNVVVRWLPQTGAEPQFSAANAVVIVLIAGRERNWHDRCHRYADSRRDGSREIV
jgi:hypothetical protein